MRSSYSWSKNLLLTILASLTGLPAAAQGVDFLNFTYRPSCQEGKEAITVKNGVFERQSPPENRLSFLVVSIHLGDLTGDRKPEAVVVTYCNTGGSGGFTEGYVFDLSGGKARELAKLEAGDRAFGGIVGIRILPPELRVTRAKGDAACCPKEFVTQTYRLENGKLTASGEPKSRPPEN